MVNHWMDFIQFRLFPATCILCGAPGEAQRDLCAHCYAELPRMGNACLRCAKPLAQGNLCGQCLKSPPPFDSAYAPFLYQRALPSLITGLKFQAQLQNARLLADLMAEDIQRRQIELPQCLLLVPLHPSRLKERGFNQALEIARLLSRRLHLPLNHQALKRIRATPPQAGLDQKARKKNLRGAFALNQPLAFDHVAVLDDVFTTGSTLREVSRMYKAAGVRRVDVWALARTP